MQATEIHGEVSSAAASAGVTLTYYTPGGDVRTIGSTEVLQVTDFSIVSAPGGAVSIKAINGTASMTMFAGTVIANGGAITRFNTPFTVPPGYALKVTSPTGQVDCVVQGYTTH